MTTECRLCLCSVRTEFSVNIYEKSKTLAKWIRSCCRLQVDKEDGLPHTICYSCESNLEMLIEFKNTCKRSITHKGSTARRFLDIAIDEDSLDDLDWEGECRASGLISDDDDVDSEKPTSNPEKMNPISIDEASLCPKQDVEMSHTHHHPTALIRDNLTRVQLQDQTEHPFWWT
ncbi:uncharacterized protein LOC143919346 isoform X2 [Arctopsyche grandis]|uniref:uncharacterized protein LOC143919346 isoform X2 n=1 Tax=Arctopsyche grandis TaxID=121162 RepID=UPI00406D8625